MLQNDRAGIVALPVLKSLSPARHLSKTFGGFSARATMGLEGLAKARLPLIH